MIKTHPNQRIYKIRKTLRDKSPKVVIDKVDLKAAYQILNKSELLVWLDMMGNIEGRTHAFSPEFYHTHYGMALSTARVAFNSLVAKGFIIEVGRPRNAYRVYSETSTEQYDSVYERVEKLTKHQTEDDIEW